MSNPWDEIEDGVRTAVATVWAVNGPSWTECDRLARKYGVDRDDVMDMARAAWNHGEYPRPKPLPKDPVKRIAAQAERIAAKTQNLAAKSAVVAEHAAALAGDTPADTAGPDGNDAAGREEVHLPTPEGDVVYYRETQPELLTAEPLSVTGPLTDAEQAMAEDLAPIAAALGKLCALDPARWPRRLQEAYEAAIAAGSDLHELVKTWHAKDQLEAEKEALAARMAQIQATLDHIDGTEPAAAPVQVRCECGTTIKDTTQARAAHINRSMRHRDWSETREVA